MVLCRIQHFQKGSRGIPTKVAPHLIDLVEHEHRIVDACTAHGLNEQPCSVAKINTNKADCTSARYIKCVMKPEAD
jgi:hypothetical protein